MNVQWEKVPRRLVTPKWQIAFLLGLFWVGLVCGVIELFHPGLTGGKSAGWTWRLMGLSVMCWFLADLNRPLLAMWRARSRDEPYREPQPYWWQRPLEVLALGLFVVALWRQLLGVV
jgi:hypothetical protein